MINASRNPTILLFGAGSVGAVYLYQLQQAGCSITAVCRSNYDIVKETGFKLNSIRYGNVSYKPDHVVRDVAETTDSFDFVVVCTKAYTGSKVSLPDQLRPALENKPSTTIVLAQNGILIEEELAAAFPQNAILSGVIYCPAYQKGPGIIEYPEMLNLFEIGTYPHDAPEHHKNVAFRFADLMIRGGGACEVHDNIQIARWSKLLMNAVWNPVCALTLCTDGEFLKTSDPYAYELAWETMMEIVELAQRMGVSEVTKEVAERKIEIAKKRAETNTGREMSMLQDILQSRPLEVEAIIGNAVHMARKNDVKVPRLATIYALVKARNSVVVRDGR